MRWLLAGLLALCLTLSGCGSSTGSTGSTETSPGDAASSDTATSDASGTQTHPDVVEVAVERAPDGTFTFDVTMSSPYDSPERYADGWRVVGADGEVYGEMTLTHDHAGEQPFTRTQTGVEVPDGVTSVVVEGRDTANGYGGGTRTVELPTT